MGTPTPDTSQGMSVAKWFRSHLGELILYVLLGSFLVAAILAQVVLSIAGASMDSRAITLVLSAFLVLLPGMMLAHHYMREERGRKDIELVDVKAGDQVLLLRTPQRGFAIYGPQKLQLPKKQIVPVDVRRHGFEMPWVGSTTEGKSVSLILSVTWEVTDFASVVLTARDSPDPVPWIKGAIGSQLVAKVASKPADEIRHDLEKMLQQVAEGASDRLRLTHKVAIHLILDPQQIKFT